MIYDHTSPTALYKSNFDKCAKIDALKLSNNEWTRVECFIDLLKHADKYQQAFSYENIPSLHTAIPALEKLHAAWDSRTTRRKYAPFVDGLRAGVTKIEEYYNKTSTSHAYTFVMLLNPDEKMSYFKKNWDAELQKEVLSSRNNTTRFTGPLSQWELEQERSLPRIQTVIVTTRLWLLYHLFQHHQRNHGSESSIDTSRVKTNYQRGCHWYNGGGEPAPTSVLEDELEVLEDDGGLDWEDEQEMQAWDTHIIDIEED
ncbi:hypothetical protein EDB83DRAFT_2318216 [Lactarius deliciosus]|nr:hypothetical protein EDB83DRAFT_2318216 [Lactarius deliciosus]